jgi:hypothetical protein
MFQLDKDEQKLFNEWLEEHDKTCPFKRPENQGAIGGRLTYCFTPTSLGVATSVKCACGEEVNVTDYGSW